MVTTFAPSRAPIGTEQDRMAAPLICTVQAPYCAMPQPNFRPGQTDHVTQHPEEGGIGLDVDLPGCSVDVDRDHCGSPPALTASS